MVLQAHGLESQEEPGILDVLGAVPCPVCKGKLNVTGECEGCDADTGLALLDAKQREQRDAAVTFVAIELAEAFGYKLEPTHRLEQALAFLKQRHAGNGDFVRWCLASWAQQCGAT